jgi:DHA1 family bicyclomycin/chloramphenicol resistance-like MFS transporter
MKNSEVTPWQFISLMGILMSFVALAIDAMLPALGEIGRDLHVKNPNDVQLVVSSIFLGMSVGLMFFGPYSDSYGRKPAIYIGMAIFMTGCLISIYSTTFEIMLIGRVLQGVGAASCRVVTLAMIRDKFEGTTMAKIMSLIMIIFILVPALAPSIGQIILLVSNWRAIFIFMLFLGVISTLWLMLKQDETLDMDKRLPFSLKTIFNGIRETLTNKISRNYTIASGLIFGAFVGYLSSSQQILQVQYNLGKYFSLVFGLLALSIGASSFANSKWVEKYGMEVLCKKSLIVLVCLAGIFLPIFYMLNGHPPLIAFVAYLMMTFFCMGILFGNFNTLAIQPLGHIAGVANSVISSLQTLISVILGGTIGHYYNGTVLPLVAGFLIFGACSLLIIVRSMRGS